MDEARQESDEILDFLLEDKPAVEKEPSKDVVEELGELIDEVMLIEDKLKEEKFYPINRAARRNAERRDKALKKRKAH